MAEHRQPAEIIHTLLGKKSYETPRALTEVEIKAIINDYSRAAKNAKEMNDLAQIELTKEQMKDMEGKDLLNFTDAVFNRKKECVNAFDKIAQYVQPKLKAIEISGELQIDTHEAWLERLSEKS